jgi:dolichyl-phosphate mannosyltransferase polypeptide 2 regulatory subunit
MQSFFLDRAWSIRLPVMLLVLAMTGLGGFMGTVAMKAAAKKKSKAA